MAIDLGARRILMHLDSQLVYRQVKGEFEAKEARMKLYLKQFQKYEQSLSELEIIQIPRDENQRADYLAKVASSAKDCKERQITLLMAPEAVLGSTVAEISEARDWRRSIREYLVMGTLPDDKGEAARIKIRATRFCMIGDEMFKRGFETPLLKCPGNIECTQILKEVHEGCCGNHMGARALAQKIVRAGYFWPFLKADAEKLVKSCEKCQKHAPLMHRPAEELMTMSSACPFAKWGIDLVGPFPMASGQRKFLIVAVDYFSKWVEAEPLAKINEEAVLRFLWKNVVCRFGVPRILVSDNGSQFAGAGVQEWCKLMKIEQRFTSVYHPQANGQVEATNKIIVQGIKKRLEKAGGKWVEEIVPVLWAYRTNPKEATGETPFSLVYGMDAVIPAEIEAETHRVLVYEEKQNEQMTLYSLDFINEKREKAFLRMEKARSRMKAAYNKAVVPRSFQVGDLVLRRTGLSQLVGKLGPNWEGPYKVVSILAGGGYKLETIKGEAVPRIWNAVNLKTFFA
jgi:transposase InsO family protein